VTNADFWVTESRNGKLARNIKVKGEVESISSGRQRELFLYRWRVPVKVLLIMSLRTCFRAHKSDSSSTELYLRSDDMLHEDQEGSVRWCKGKGDIPV